MPPPLALDLDLDLDSLEGEFLPRDGTELILLHFLLPFLLEFSPNPFLGLQNSDRLSREVDAFGLTCLPNPSPGCGLKEARGLERESILH